MKKFKRFFAWQFEREGQYLTRMLHQGQELIDLDVWPRYVFKRTLPTNGVVQVDYQPKQDLPAYQQLLEDAGWRVMATRPQLWGMWVYWYNPDPTAVLYSDRATLCELLKRIRLRWSLWGIVLVAWWCYLIWSSQDLPGYVVDGIVGCFYRVCVWRCLCQTDPPDSRPRAPGVAERLPHDFKYIGTAKSATGKFDDFFGGTFMVILNGLQVSR